MIDGVKINKLKTFKDVPDLKQKIEPGIFVEVLRNEDQLLKNFAQSNFTVAHQDTIKGFHWHKYQDDLWFLASGRAGIVLYDRRKGSKTQGITQVIYAGEGDYKLVLIPRGVAHGYKVLSQEPCLFVYFMNKEYNRANPDEQHIDPYDKKINFDWKGLK